MKCAIAWVTALFGPMISKCEIHIDTCIELHTCGNIENDHLFFHCPYSRREITLMLNCSCNGQPLYPCFTGLDHAFQWQGCGIISPTFIGTGTTWPHYCPLLETQSIIWKSYSMLWSELCWNSEYKCSKWMYMTYIVSAHVYINIFMHDVTS